MQDVLPADAVVVEVCAIPITPTCFTIQITYVLHPSWVWKCYRETSWSREAATRRVQEILDTHAVSA